jgi:GNAT superfamily N-acetyltransferase
MDPADVVHRFLESVGRRSEAEFYLALFRAETKESFATIAVDASLVRHAAEAVVLDLRFLAALGLTPVVVVGLTDAHEIEEQVARLRRRLERGEVPVAVLSRGEPDAELHAAIAAAARKGIIPIVPFGPAEGSVEQRFARLGALLASLRTRKLIVLNRRGGLRHRGATIPIVNLTTEYDALAASTDLAPKQRALLAEARRLVFERVPHKLTIAVTSPLDLLRELFTVKGAGTLLRRGAVIETREGFASVDVAKLRALLAASFGRAPADSFFERPVSRIYLEEGYRGVAIVEETPLGTYLTKFAVEREAQGEGMGRDLWEALVAAHPTIFWRARPDNPIGAWYTKLCDGMIRGPEWQVFWKGLPTDKVAEAVAWTLARPVDIPAGV